MIWETIVVCITILILFGPFARQKAREIEIENDQREDENLHRNYNDEKRD